MIKPLSEGMYQYDIADADSKSRIHLRVDPDLSGLLVVNASRVMHLNPSALYMAYLTLEKLMKNSPSQALQDRFKALPNNLNRIFLPHANGWKH